MEPNSGVQVPEIECPLSPGELSGLNDAVSQLRSSNFGADIYLVALQYLQTIGLT